MADGDHLGAAAGERPQLVALEAQVHGHDPGSGEPAQPTALEHPALQLGGERLLPSDPGLGLGDLTDQVPNERD